jgi:hypothetical protein
LCIPNACVQAFDATSRTIGLLALCRVVVFFRAKHGQDRTHDPTFRTSPAEYPRITCGPRDQPL